ncbi:subtype B tannase [Deinococcus aquaticus]|uniref:subtype B tannase n=1 Tax=Deinococcus aquaticus TaxID=328692 RepID=UPI003F461895
MKRLAFLTISSALLLSACSLTTRMTSGGTVSGTDVSTLRFDATKYTSGSTTVNGQVVKYRAYENVVYVERPEDAKYQNMNIYIPEAYFSGETVGSYTAQTAPIFLPNQVGGYLPGLPGTVAGGGLGGTGFAAGGQAPVATTSATTPSTTTTVPSAPATSAMPAGGRAGGTSSGPNAIQTALSRGYVVASPGARGRTSKNAAGEYIGKAPAAIVDLKAAVAYLHYNDAVMPGTAERIVSNGTSAGGALSVLLGATGNSPDYAPYLKAAGAAPARDDVYATSAYAPITNLEHADSAYEWLFDGVTTYTPAQYGPSQTAQTPTPLTAKQITASSDLKAMFSPYVNSLKLTQDGQALTLDDAGNGSFKAALTTLIQQSAQRALDAGTDLSSYSYLTISGGKVTAVDLAAYASAAKRQKAPPAFDGLSLESGENDLFGTRTVNTRHFTAYGQANTAVSATQADAQTVKLMNPMEYIGTSGATTAAYWRVRHGTADRDTSLAIPLILATKLADSGKSVDFLLPWNVPHSGDYDLTQLFDWADKAVKQ